MGPATLVGRIGRDPLDGRDDRRLPPAHGGAVRQRDAGHHHRHAAGDHRRRGNGHGELAEELAQETFVRAYRNLSGLKDDLRLSTWLFGIARNVVRESVRQSRKDERKVGLDEPESLKLESGFVLPEGSMLDRELTETIHRALAELDDDKRIVFSLKIFHEKSYEEISSITGHSIGKLKTDLHRARAEMRKRLEPYLAV